MKKLIQYGLDILNVLGALFIFTIFAISFYTLVTSGGGFNIITSRMYGNHTFIYFILGYFAIVNIIYLKYNNNEKYVYLNAGLYTLFIVFLHEFLWFIFTIPHLIYANVIGYMFWIYGILINAVILLSLSFLVHIKIDKMFYLYYACIWAILFLWSYTQFHMFFVFSSDGYTQNLQYHDNVIVNFIEIIDWVTYLGLANMFTEFKYSFVNRLMVVKNV